MKDESVNILCVRLIHVNKWADGAPLYIYIYIYIYLSTGDVAFGPRGPLRYFHKIYSCRCIIVHTLKQSACTMLGILLVYSGTVALSQSE